MKAPAFVPAIADRSQLVPLDFGRLFVRDLGPDDADAVRPPLLLIHGLLVHGRAFHRLVPELADRRLLIPDLPGAGDSDRPPPVHCAGYSPVWLARALLALLDRLGVARVDVLGHSWGGAIAVCLADAAPARVRRLALIDPTLFAMPVPFEGRLALLPRLGPYMFQNMYRRNELRRYLGRAFSSEKLVDEADVDLYWDRLARSGGREAAHAMLMQLLGADTMAAMLPRMRALTAPTLVVWGDRDGIVPREHADRVAAAIPGAALRWIEGCGHSPPEEQPEALAALLREHLDAPLRAPLGPAADAVAGAPVVGASAHP